MQIYYAHILCTCIVSKCHCRQFNSLISMLPRRSHDRLQLLLRTFSRFYILLFHILICHECKAAASVRRRTESIILHRGVWRSISIGLSYEWAAQAAVPRFPHTAAADSLHVPIQLRDCLWGFICSAPGRQEPAG
jgi:hypothetical protein